MGTSDRSVSGEAQDLCEKVSQEQSVRLISDNCEGEESCFPWTKSVCTGLA